jgi:hypothetical protein
MRRGGCAGWCVERSDIRRSRRRWSEDLESTVGHRGSVQSAQFRQRAPEIADLNLIGSACKRWNTLQAGALEVLHLTQSGDGLFPQRFADRHPKGTRRHRLPARNR